MAATATSTFNVTMTIGASCTVISASTMAFGSSGVILTNVDQTSSISVQCTDTTPYAIGLNAGVGAGATVATRKMSNGARTINYTLYSNAGRSTVWGDTPGTDTVAGVGNGDPQAFTVYGRVAPQTTPAPGSYTDTITVTVTY